MKDVLLRIKSTQLVDGEEGRIELVTDGKYEYSDGSAVFEYQESVLTGFAGTTTRFEITPGEATISRTGSLRSVMVFRLGARNDFLYETDECSMAMSLNTHTLSCVLDENGGTVDIGYVLEVASVKVSYNTFHIEISEDKHNGKHD